RADLTPVERDAASVLRGWNHVMAPTSAAAAIWWTFWSGYLSATFEPWWRGAAGSVPGHPARLRGPPPPGCRVAGPGDWTLADPSNPVFTPPGARVGTAAVTMRTAFSSAVTKLSALLGGQPSSWALDELSGARVAQSAQVPVLSYSPGTRRSRPWMAASTPSAVPPYPGGRGDQGWRMIIRLRAGQGGIDAEGIYSGGQSENPASPWYGNLTGCCRKGRYLVLPSAKTAVAGPDTGQQTQWELLP